MLRNMQATLNGKRIFGTPNAGIIASQILAETATGDSGPGILYNEAQQAEYVGTYLRAIVVSKPAVGTVFVHENGAIDVSGLPNGTHALVYQLVVDNELQSGTATSYFDVGIISASATGATLSGTSSLSPGAASGQQNASASGATLAGTADLAPGAASGVASGTAAGVTLEGSSDLSPGLASVQQDASAIGATLTGTADLSPGSASGQQNTTAPGATLSGSGDIQPGEAVGAAPGVAPGVTLTGTADLTPGLATSPDAQAPGVTLSGSANLVAGTAHNDDVIVPGSDRYRLKSYKRIMRAAATRRIYKVTKMTRQLPTMDVEEIKKVTFDFSNDADSLSDADVSIVAVDGDPVADPDVMKIGTRLISGPLVTQMVSGGDQVATYRIRCKATDADGEVHVLAALLPVEVT